MVYKNNVCFGMVFMLFEYKCLISLRNKICVLDINGDKFYKEKIFGI